MFVWGDGLKDVYNTALSIKHMEMIKGYGTATDEVPNNTLSFAD